MQPGKFSGLAVRRWATCLVVLALLAAVATTASAADPDKGKRLYNRNCANCHGSNGMGTMPGLPDFSRGEALLQPDVRLKSAIEQGKGLMPAYRGLLTEQEILDVIAYLRTLRR